jgi:hypothetical protein
MIFLEYDFLGGFIMTEIRKSADLRNNYGKISDFCHKYREPVFITKNDIDLCIAEGIG